MAQSKYRDNPPTSQKTMGSGGLVTNAHPGTGWPNGMEFDKPEVEQYFTEMQEQHWRDEDGPSALPQPWSPSDWELRQRVESSRFLHRPVTGNQGPKTSQDTEE